MVGQSSINVNIEKGELRYNFITMHSEVTRSFADIKSPERHTVKFLKYYDAVDRLREDPIPRPLNPTIRTHEAYEVNKDRPVEKITGIHEKGRFYYHDCKNVLTNVNAIVTSINPNADILQPENQLTQAEREELVRLKSDTDRFMVQLRSERTDLIDEGYMEIEKLRMFFNSNLLAKAMLTNPMLQIPMFQKFVQTANSSFDLNVAYFDLIKFWEKPDRKHLEVLLEGSLHPYDILMKFAQPTEAVKTIFKDEDAVDILAHYDSSENGTLAFHHEVEADNIHLSKADALILLSAANKFGGELQQVQYHKEDGSIELIGTPRKDTDKNAIDIRVDRYAEGFEDQRPVPTREEMRGDVSEFTSGLFAGELLGYAIGRDIIYRVREGVPTLIITPAKKELIEEVPTISHAVGERAGFREINTEDYEDMARMWSTDREMHSETVSGLKQWIIEQQQNPNTQIYAVTAQTHADNTPIHSVVRGEVEGWIHTRETRAERDRLKRLSDPELPDSFPVTEVSTMLRIKSSLVNPLLPSAMRQILIQKIRDDVQNGIFVGKQGEMVRPRRVVTAFVDSKDPQYSIKERSLDEAGFVRKGSQVTYDEGDSAAIGDYYVLDWDKLQEIEQRQTQEVILGKLHAMSYGGERPTVIPSTPDNLEGDSLSRLRRQINREKKKKH